MCLRKNFIMKIAIKTILFDLDGTLIDSELCAATVMKDCFEQWGIQLLPQDVTYITGRTWELTSRYLFSKYSFPLSQDLARSELITRYRQALETNVQIVPGSVQAVESLAQKFPLGLVSGSCRSDISSVLKKLGIQKHFQIILGAEDYPHSKPAPDGYLKAIQTLQADPQSCLVFEDSQAGIASARAANLWVVAITSTNHFQQDQSQAHAQIQDLSEISPQWVQDLSFD